MYAKGAYQKRLAISCGLMLLTGCEANTEKAPLTDQQYFEQVMLAPAILPKDLSNSGCLSLENESNLQGYKSAAEVNYQQAGWQNRVAADWQYFLAPEQPGKLLLIDYQVRAGQLAYRYLSDGSHNELYEPGAHQKFKRLAVRCQK